MKEVGKIYKSKDYEKFKFILGNRTPNKRVVAELVSSMKVEQLIIPIVVNEKYEITDGQHRFLAMQELGLPVYYIINDGYGLDQIIRANSTGTIWGVDDYLSLHKSTGKKDYEILEELQSSHNLSINSILKVICKFENYPSLTAVRFSFEQGDLKILNLSEVKKFLTAFDDIKSNVGRHKNNALLSAFIDLYTVKPPFNYDHEQMVKKVQRFGSILSNGRDKNELLGLLCNNIYSIGERTEEHKICFNVANRRFHK